MQQQPAITPLSIFLATGLFSSLSMAEQTEQLGQVVITATGYEQSLQTAPASISVITREDLQKHSYRDLTDALRSVPGVVISSGGSRQDISLRGMPGEYTAILVDGKKQSSRETRTNSGAVLEADWMPPLDTIERIEVIKGPMSTLYGSDAMGGVINIITRKDVDEWSGNLKLETVLQTNAESGSYQQQQVALQGPLVKGVAGLRFSALQQDREEDEIERGYPGKELTNYNGSLFLTPGDNHEFTFDFSRRDHLRETTVGKTLPSGNSSETENQHRVISLSHEGDIGLFTAKSYISVEEAENLSRDIAIKNTVVNSQWLLPTDAHYLTVGVNFAKEELEDNNSNANPDVNQISNQQWSLFFEDEWQLTDDFSLTYGLRLDDNEEFDQHVSPRLYGVYSLNSSWTLKGGVASGYKTPALRELAESWATESRGGDIYGNPDLKPETTLSKEVGLSYLGEDTLAVNFTLFHNDFEDKIVLEDCPASACDGDATGRRSINVDEAVTYGAELSIEKEFFDRLMLSAAYTYTHSEQTSGENKGLPLTKLPENEIALNADLRVTDSVNLWTRWTHRSKESEATASGSRNIVAPSYTFIDVGGSWNLTDYAKISMGLYNLTDKEITYDEYGYVEDGRRLWLALDVGF